MIEAVEQLTDRDGPVAGLAILVTVGVVVAIVTWAIFRPKGPKK